MSEPEINKDVLRRLDVIIGLLFDLIAIKDEKRVEGKEMLRLKELGMENPEIARLFSKTADQVKKQVYAAKKQHR